MRRFVALAEIPFGSIERQVGIYYKKGQTLKGTSEAFVDVCRCCLLYTSDAADE